MQTLLHEGITVVLKLRLWAIQWRTNVTKYHEIPVCELHNTVSRLTKHNVLKLSLSFVHGKRAEHAPNATTTEMEGSR